jgi:hypothetical protein
MESCNTKAKQSNSAAEGEEDKACSLWKVAVQM